MAGIGLGDLARRYEDWRAGPGLLDQLAAAFPQRLDAGSPGQTVAQAAPPPTSLTPQQWDTLGNFNWSGGIGLGRGSTGSGRGTRDMLDLLVPSWKRTTGDDMTFPVSRNPNTRDVGKMLKSSGGTLRAGIDHGSGDVYVWGGENALHEEIGRQLGLPMFEASGQIYSPGGLDALYAKAKTGPGS